MPSKISRLTAKQKALLPEWKKRWIEIGLRTGPADHERWERGACKCYQASGFAWPGNPIWVSSPIIGALAASISRALLKNTKKGSYSATRSEVHSVIYSAVSSAVNSAVSSAVRSSVSSAVHSAVESEVGSAVRSSVYSAVSSAVRSSVSSEVYSAVSSEVYSAVSSAVHSAVDSAVDSAIDSAVYSAVSSAVNSAVNSAVDSAVDSAVESEVPLKLDWHSCLGGQFWASWSSWVNFLLDACNLTLSPEILTLARAYEDTVLSASYWWPNLNFVMVSERPSIIFRNSLGQLHADGRKAIQWPDGWGLYMLNGVRVPHHIVETPADKLDLSIILKEKNAEIRREIIRKIGIERVCTKLGAQVLDTQGDYELLTIDLNDGLRRPYLKMKNPSIGTYHVEGVPTECDTVEKALNWRNESSDPPEVLT